MSISALGEFGRTFKYQYPKFGRGEKNRLPISSTKVSPYYWWWEFLRRNDDYRSCCEKNGSSKLSALYKDFGDVYELEFRLWWGRLNRGAYLFAEPKPLDRINRFSSIERFNDYTQLPNIVMVAVPMDAPKGKLIKSFNLFLKDHHTTTRGRRKVVSYARYTFSSIPNVLALEQALLVYDYWKNDRKEGKKTSLADIGLHLRLVREFIPRSSDKPSEITAKRNKMSATVSRYITEATAMIENIVDGSFPNKSRPKAVKKESHINKPKMEIYQYWMLRKEQNPKIALADIGFELKLGKSEWQPIASDSAEVVIAKRNKMSATVSRYMKNAKSVW